MGNNRKLDLEIVRLTISTFVPSLIAVLNSIREPLYEGMYAVGKARSRSQAQVANPKRSIIKTCLSR